MEYLANEKGSSLTPEYNLLYYIADYFKKQIAHNVVNCLKSIDADGSLLSGDDSGLVNMWEEICAQVQGEESIHWDLYEDAIQNTVISVIDRTDVPIRQLFSYLFSDEESPINMLPTIDDYAMSSVIMSELMTLAADEDNENIRKYLEGGFEDEDEEEEEEEEVNDDEDHEGSIDKQDLFNGK